MRLVVKVKYSARILVDKYFIKWLIEYDKIYFWRLLHIKISSVDHKKRHNLMLECDAEEILKEGKIGETTLRSALKGIPIPKFVSKILPKKIDQMVIFAMILSNEPPYHTYIFTTRKKEGEYLASKHLKSVKSVSLKCEMDAITIIEAFWKQFVYRRDLYKDN